MKYTALLCALMLLCVGCDAQRQIAGPEETTATVNLKAGTYDVRYEVTGTYATCQMTYRNQDRELVSTQESTLPWTRSFRVFVNKDTGIFGASVRITCADPTKTGKATLHLIVDEDVKERISAVGFGASAEAIYRVGTQ